MKHKPLMLAGMLSALLTVGCGTATVEEKQTVEVNITISYPDCTPIKNYKLRIACIEEASSLSVGVDDLDIEDLLEESL